MNSIGMPNTQYSVTLNGILIQGAANYSNSLTANNIVEDAILRFSMFIYFLSVLNYADK